ncbi:hypothetical protein OMP43_03885 [Sphingomonas sp. CBMAI 2297]|uniref:DUF6602 domain-containing protein n=1 Tax=Sphingomonas sp. CBMAI 2297 TaxID=2991720 RepID=UPI00245402BC|nr:DUF6602 domain-containing protein [Sphingomonas sp. CBMAI 2297]MDH4743155.1 hypothetical protein [Sphingomonas sp. CBMAI 2297]
MPEEHPLYDFLNQVTNEMASEYRRIVARAAQDPGTAGDEGEENWASLLRDWIPAGYHVRTKGRLISVNGRLSDQIDVVVLKPSYPPKLLEKKLWLADGVAAAFECKTTLNAKHLKDAADRGQKLKSLLRRRFGTPRSELTSPLVYGVLAHSHSWKGKKSTPLANIEDTLTAASEPVPHPALLVDLVCVADLATWTCLVDTTLLFTREGDGRKWDERGPRSTFMRLATDRQPDREPPTPIGVMLMFLFEKMAREDSSLKEIARYFVRTQTSVAVGYGKFRAWNPMLLSHELHMKLSKQKYSSDPDPEWKFSFS